MMTRGLEVVHSVLPEFKEGDVIVRVLRGGTLCDQDRSVLLKNDIAGEAGWWTLCFVHRDHQGTESLDLTGIRASAFEYYRLAEPDERFQILSAMVGLNFGTHRGPDYFLRWEPKLISVIRPLIDQLKK